MQSVHDHYERHLATVYSWMVGGVEAAVCRGEDELDALALLPDGHALAVDLGAGFGMHAIPLARRGFAVLAVDSSAELLRELVAHAAGLSIHTAEVDLLQFRAHVAVKPSVVLCMGDTLPHLPSLEAVESLFAEVASALRHDGLFVLTFRDYTVALEAERRFIPVRSDADRIMTCALEYQADYVIVNDLLYERNGARWELRVSSYRKLRLAPAWTFDVLAKLGFQVTRDAAPGGMIRLVARKIPGHYLQACRARLVRRTTANAKTDSFSQGTCSGRIRLLDRNL